MNVVLDTSAAIELVLNLKHSKTVRSQLANCNKVITSDLYKAETTNVFWKYVRGNHLSKRDAITFLEFTKDLIDEYIDMESYRVEALSEGLRLGHSTYDMMYLTLAKRSGALLLTMDKKLQKLAAKEGIETLTFEG